MSKWEELREKFAELEHEQWITWASDVAKKEKLSPERLARWNKYLIPYKDLPEDVKDYDRKWADKVLVLVKSLLLKERQKVVEQIEKERDLAEKINIDYYLRHSRANSFDLGRIVACNNLLSKLREDSKKKGKE